MFLVFCLFILASQACSTAKVRVMREDDGTNRVVSRDIERDDAEEEAFDAAEDFCEDQGKRVVVLKDEGTKYTGSMNEDTRKTVRNASKAAMILSGPTGVVSKSVPVGAVVGAAGTTGYVMTNDRDYTAELRFRCE
jgi:uncharacterized protein (DUF2345 family)